MLLKQQLLLNLLSILIALSVLMIVAYIQERVTEWSPGAYPFGMSEKHVIMKRESEQRVTFDDIIDVDKDTGVVVISRDENSKTIGVYDPNMVMAFRNTSALGIGIARYFSYDDYVNKTKVGILVSYADNRDYTSDNISEVLYCTHVRDAFNYDGNTKEVVNLASMDTLGEYVFLDYGDKQVADRIIKRLRNFGYRRHNLMEQIGLLKALLNANIFPDGNILTAGLLIYLFFGVASYWHFYNDRKKISVHFLHGGTLKKMAGKITGRFFGFNLLGLIPVLLFCYFLRKTDYFIMTNFSLFMFLAAHVLVTTLMYFMTYYIVFAMIRRSERGDSYVR